MASRNTGNLNLADLLRLVRGVGGQQTAQAAKATARPRITQTGGRAVGGAGTLPVGPVLAAAPAAGLGGLGTIGSIVAAQGILKLIEGGSNLVGGVGGALAQQAAPPPPVPTNSERYLIPQISPLAYQQNYQQELMRRALLSQIPVIGPSIVQNLPELDRPLSQKEAFDLTQLAAERLGQRDRERDRIRGELAALPAGYQAIGTQSQALGGALQSAINTVLERAPIEKSLALQSIATKNQFSN